MQAVGGHCAGCANPMDGAAERKRSTRARPPSLCAHRSRRRRWRRRRPPRLPIRWPCCCVASSSARLPSRAGPQQRAAPRPAAPLALRASKARWARGNIWHRRAAGPRCCRKMSAPALPILLRVYAQSLAASLAPARPPARPGTSNPPPFLYEPPHSAWSLSPGVHPRTCHMQSAAARGRITAEGGVRHDSRPVHLDLQRFPVSAPQGSTPE